jgi:hypothetical protein
MKKKKVALEIVNPYAAGIDVGSRSHYVAIGQSKEEVREFGVYAQDLKELTHWLQQNNLTTVAMESTGTYWQNLFSTLQEAGLKVILVNGKFTKNIHGKKTDVKDCQWLQKLHSIGLLTGSFLPDAVTEQLRTYCRHRTNLIDTAADTTRKMQKYLRLLHLRLDIVVRDITGQTGLCIIEAVCKEKAMQKHWQHLEMVTAESRLKKLPKHCKAMGGKITSLPLRRSLTCIKHYSRRSVSVIRLLNC